MDGIGAALGDERDLCARAVAVLGAGVGGDCAELLDRVEGDTEDAGKGGAVLLVVHVDTVESDGGLVALAAIDAATAEIVLVGGIGLAEVGDAGLQRKQADDVTGFERQLRDYPVPDSMADGGVRGVYLDRLAVDGD